jgi:hypothetical protein
MSFSVTKNVSAATDVTVLLSSLGFEPANEAHLELVIDQFEQWSNARSDAKIFTCGASYMQLAA